MACLVIRHKVTDFAKWKTMFDAHGDARRQAGSRGGKLYRNADNPNETLIVLEWDSVANARKFTQSPDLQETMKRAGVADEPSLFFLDEGELVKF